MDSRHLPRRIASLVPVTLVLLALPSWASDVAWTETGAPNSGNVYKVIVDASDTSTVYALSDPGVFESTDGGTSWSLILPVPGTLLDIAMAPSDPTTLYATNFNKKVYKTSDGGATWATVTDPVTTAGQTQIIRATVDPADKDVVYVLTDNSGIYKSVDGGTTWNPINTGLTTLIAAVAGSVNDIIFDRLIVDPTDSNVLYLGVSADVSHTNPGGLYKSTNGGGSWSAASLGTLSVKDIDMDPADHTHLVAVTCDSGNGSFYSVTGSGATPGTPVALSSPCPVRVRFDPSDNTHLYMGEADGLYESADSVASWSPDSTVAVQQIEDIAIDPVTPANVFVSTGAWGIYRSADSGATWNLSNTGINDVVPNTLFTGTDGVIYIGSVGTGVLKSTDGGASWAEANSGLPVASGDINVNALVQDPGTPATLYAGTQFGLFQTVDGGQNWSLVNNGITDAFSTAIAFDPQVHTTLYDGTVHGFFKSIDGGVTWNSAGAGLPATPDIISIAVDPTDSNIVFAGSDYLGLYLSTDGGADFAPANSGLSPSWITSIAFDPADHNTVYVSTLNQRGFFVSVDGGASWSESDNGFPFSDPNFDGFAQVVTDPTDAATIFLMPYLPGATGTPVYFSTDSGADWSIFTTATTLQAQAAAQVSRAMHTRAPIKAASSTVNMTWLTFSPTKQVLGMGADHKIYVLGSTSASGGGGSSGGGSSGGGSSGGGSSGGGSSGGGSGGGGAAASGGGGTLPPIGIVALLGILAIRRKLSIASRR